MKILQVITQLMSIPLLIFELNYMLKNELQKTII